MSCCSHLVMDWEAVYDTFRHAPKKARIFSGSASAMSRETALPLLRALHFKLKLGQWFHFSYRSVKPSSISLFLSPSTILKNSNGEIPRASQML